MCTLRSPLPDTADDSNSHAIRPKGSSINLPGGTQSDPSISPVTTSTMITTSNSLVKGAGRSISVAVIDFTPYAVTSYPAYEPTSTDG